MPKEFPPYSTVQGYFHAWSRHVFADGGYAGDELRAALKGKGSWSRELIKRSDAAKGFEALPRRGSAALLGSVAAAGAPRTSKRHSRQRRLVYPRRAHPHSRTTHRKTLTPIRIIWRPTLRFRVRVLALAKADRAKGMWSRMM